MRNVVIVWPESELYLVKEICLPEAARWHHQRYQAKIDVLAIGDWSIIGHLKEELSDYGYTLHNASGLLERLRARYPNLAQRYSYFHYNAFLRWVALAEYFKGENNFICFDADLVISSPVLTEPSLVGESFTSTSTCFTVINDEQWLRGYCEAIQQMNDDWDGFKAHFDEIKDDFVVGARDICEVNEETLVRYLSKAGRIPNRFPRQYPFWMTPSHLEYYSDRLCLQQTIQLPVRYERTATADEFNGRPLTFIHFQHLFREYLCTFLMFEKIFGLTSLQRVEPEFFRHNNWTRRRDFLDLQQNLRDRTVRGEFGHEYLDLFTRRNVMEEFLFKRDFSQVFNDAHWHTPGFFAG